MCWRRCMLSINIRLWTTNVVLVHIIKEKLISFNFTYNVRHVTPGLKICAHDAPVYEEIDDQEECWYHQRSDDFVVIHEAGKTTDVHDYSDKLLGNFRWDLFENRCTWAQMFILLGTFTVDDRWFSAVVSTERRAWAGASYCRLEHGIFWMKYWRQTTTIDDSHFAPFPLILWTSYTTVYVGVRKREFIVIHMSQCGIICGTREPRDDIAPSRAFQCMYASNYRNVAF